MININRYLNSVNLDMDRFLEKTAELPDSFFGSDTWFGFTVQSPLQLSNDKIFVDAISPLLFCLARNEKRSMAIPKRIDFKELYAKLENNLDYLEICLLKSVSVTLYRTGQVEYSEDPKEEKLILKKHMQQVIQNIPELKSYEQERDLWMLIDYIAPRT